MRDLLSRAAARIFLAGFFLLLPVMPILAALLFARWRFVRHYGQTLRKMHAHRQALSQGPVEHYFRDVLGRVRHIPADIRGSCVQCGNCCMNKQCAFLEPVATDRYQCGIYHSPLRRFSNCGSFPLSQHDIERYACPSYFVVAPAGSAVAPKPLAELRAVPVRIVKSTPAVDLTEQG